jgi:enoyl-CoA hydratase/carnithine racemase
MPLVVREDCGGVASLTLNRPEKLNALTSSMFAELDGHLSALEAQRNEIGVVILGGAGRCFSAGHDLEDIKAGEGAARPNSEGKVIERLASLPQPVIVAVHGHCYTGALELALAGDLIVACDDARFADTHAKFALAPIWGLSQRLVRRVGAYKAREMILLCATYDAQQALAMGLVNFVFSKETFAAEIDGLARQVVALSWFSHRANKRLILETDGMRLTDGLAYEYYRGAGLGPDHAHRIATFLER